MRDFFDTISVTQLTAGELSLNSAMCLCDRSEAIPSMHSHRGKSPAISRLEFVILPFGFVEDTMPADISGGH